MIAIAFAFTVSTLTGADAPPQEDLSPPTYAAPELTGTDAPEEAPTYAAPETPIQERREIPPSDTAKVITAVVGTLVAVTVGLIASGYNTGKHYKPKANTAQN